MKKNIKRFLSLMMIAISVLLPMLVLSPLANAETSEVGPICKGNKAYYKTSLSYKKYKWFAKKYSPEKSFVIPGLTSTDVLGNDCDSMVPQGFCFANEYVLVSAYDSNEEYNSVLYVLSRDGEYLTTLVIDSEKHGKTHNGGLAFDGRNVWIAGKSGGYVCSIGYEQIVSAVQSGKASIAVTITPFKIKNGHDFLEYYNGYLWVGSFKSDAPCNMCAYSYDVENPVKLTKVAEITLPSKIQGAHFFEANGATLLVLSRSFCRTCLNSAYDSELIVYNMGELELKEEMTLPQADKTIAMPPMIEDLAIDNGYLYVAFESAAKKYRKTDSKSLSDRLNDIGKYSIDLVAAISLQDILDSGDVTVKLTFIEKLALFVLKIMDMF